MNFYVVNRAASVPEFRDALAGQKAKSTLQDLFPDWDFVQLNTDAIAAGGDTSCDSAAHSSDALAATQCC